MTGSNDESLKFWDIKLLKSVKRIDMKSSIPFQLITIKPKDGGPLLISGHD